MNIPLMQTNQRHVPMTDWQRGVLLYVRPEAVHGTPEAIEFMNRGAGKLVQGRAVVAPYELICKGALFQIHPDDAERIYGIKVNDLIICEHRFSTD